MQYLGAMDKIVFRSHTSTTNPRQFIDHQNIFWVSIWNFGTLWRSQW